LHFPTARLVAAAVIVTGFAGVPAAQEQPERPVFRSAVEMVSMAAVVRDRRGRVVPALTREDFEVFDTGTQRPIVDMRTESTAPGSVALLVDGSGSMRVGATLDAARIVADAVLQHLDGGRDEAALFTFDSRLLELQEFTQDFDPIRARLEDLEAFGTTSLYDAIAQTAREVAPRAHHRRAVVVLTDGDDTSSSRTAAEVSAIASSIDVPVYVFALNAQGPEEGTGPLADLARWTGGEFYPAGNRALAAAAIRQLVQELRHQYVIAFEPVSSSGYRRVEIRTRRRGLTVRTRSWYFAGSGE
jgi:Ca-activated chloride channel homolog